MALKSPLRSAKPNAVSVCGKILTKGQTISVPETAIGPREKQLEAQKKISIKDSNKKGQVQITCTLK